MDLFSQFAFRGDGSTVASIGAQAHPAGPSTAAEEPQDEGAQQIEASTLEAATNMVRQPELPADQDIFSRCVYGGHESNKLALDAPAVKPSESAPGVMPLETAPADSVSSIVEAEPDVSCPLETLDLAADHGIFERCVYVGHESKDLDMEAPTLLQKRKSVVVGPSTTDMPLEADSPSTAEPAEDTPHKASQPTDEDDTTPNKLLAPPLSLDSDALTQFAFGGAQAARLAAEFPTLDEADEILKLAQVVKPAAVKSRRVAAKQVTSKEPEHPTFKEADALGLGSAFRNLVARDEVANSGLSMERLLEYLRDADGLVNKAKMDISTLTQAGETITLRQSTKATAVKRRRVTPATSKLMEPEHPAFKEADALGLGGALRNLAARDDIVNSSLPMERLLESLRDANGLVNKAKTALLGM